MLRRVGATVAVVAAVVVSAVAGYVITSSDPVPDAGSTPGFSNAVQATVTGSSPKPSSSAPHQPVVTFLGDDYTIGVGASRADKRFSSLLATSLNVAEQDFAGPGDGYAKRGADGESYADRVDAVVAAKPDVVVVSGGRNDTSDYPATLDTAVHHLFASLRARLPKAKLIAVAPFWGDSDQPPELVALSSAIKTAVHSADGTYVALPDPLHNHSGYMSNATDPNDAGYLAIVNALKPRLAALISG